MLGMVSQVAARAGARLVQAGTHPCTRPAAVPRCMQSLRAVSAARPVALPHGVVRNITFTTAAFETVGKGITLDALRLEDLEPETLRSKRSRRRRLRQHVNPLASAFQVPSELPPLDTIFADASRPLHLDIGCGRGDLVASMSTVRASPTCPRAWALVDTRAWPLTTRARVHVVCRCSWSPGSTTWVWT